LFVSALCPWQYDQDNGCKLNNDLMDAATQVGRSSSSSDGGSFYTVTTREMFLSTDSALVSPSLNNFFLASLSCDLQ
jgi:hypothetical protein